MGVLAKILGADSVIKEGFNLIDSLHTSKEEEILAQNKAKTDLLEAYAPFKVAQRVLAIMFTTTFLGSYLLVLGMTLAGRGNASDAISVLNQFYIGEIMLSIVIFYFGSGAAEGIVGKIKAK